MYLADSSSSAKGPRELKAYLARDDGTLGRPIVLHTFSAGYRGLHRGAAGMCVTSEGNILVTAGSKQSGPGPMVYVFAPSGQVLESHLVSAGAPTNCAFGGAELSTLFVMTQDNDLFQVKNTGRKGVTH